MAGTGEEQQESKSVRKRTLRNGPSNNVEYPCNSGRKGLALAPKVLHRSLPTPKQDSCLRVLRAPLNDSEMKTFPKRAVLCYHFPSSVMETKIREDVLPWKQHRASASASPSGLCVLKYKELNGRGFKSSPE